MIEKGDKFGLPGMIMGIEALGSLACYLLLESLILLISVLPSGPPMEDLELMIISLWPVFCFASIPSIIAGVVLSSIGWKINRSKMGTLGLIFSAGALVLLLILIFVIVPRFSL